MGTLIHWWWFGICMWWWRLRNAPEDRALIMVRQGHYYWLEFGNRRCVTKDGDVLQYGRHIVLANDKIPFESFEDERFLGLVDGEVVQSPFTGTGERKDETLISDFMQGNAVVQLSESIEQPGRRGGLDFKTIRWLLLGVAIIVIGIVVWKFVLHGQLPGSTPTPTLTPTPTAPPGPPWEPVSAWIGEWAGYVRGVIGV